jgi:hypothetical protein
MPEPTPEAYKGFRITPTPAQTEGGYRLGARIEKDVDGEVRVHHLLRADVLGDRDAAEAASLRKARQVIDEQGDGLFD